MDVALSASDEPPSSQTAGFLNVSDSTFTPSLSLQRRALTPAQEIIAVSLRRYLWLSLDDSLSVMRRFLKADLSRSALARCLKRQNVAHLVELMPKMRALASPKKRLQDKPGFVFCVLIPVHTLETQGYIWLAIDRASRWVFFDWSQEVSLAHSERFLQRLSQAAPFHLRLIAHPQVTPFGGKEGSAFQRMCQAQGIETWRLNDPQWLKPLAIKTAWPRKKLIKRLTRVLTEYNSALTLRVLGGETPLQRLTREFHLAAALFRFPPTITQERSMLADDLKSTELYFNRELSLLKFNRRVLELALDTQLPLLERLKFLCISSTNLDEFFEIRAAGVQEQVMMGVSATAADGMTPKALLEAISEEANGLVNDQYEVLNKQLIPAMAEEGIQFVRRTHWNEQQALWVENYFNENLAPLLSPLGLDLAHPFPRILNKSLNFVVSLQGKDAFGRESGLAVVQAPRSLPRIIQLSKELAEADYAFVFLSSIIHAHVGKLFPGMEVTGCYQFRVTRNSDLFIDEEAADDLMLALEGELPSRRYGNAVRLEVADNCPADTYGFLLRQFSLTEDDLFQVHGPVNLNRLMAVTDLVNRPDLKFAPFSPAIPQGFNVGNPIFQNISKQDQLIHTPYQSFLPVIEFIRQAARDPDVLAIKMTLYRTGSRSELVKLLIEAAEAGKEVTVVVELRARFDEEANIKLANRLQDAGAHILYGVVGYKTHAKMIMVVRREKGDLRRYVHLGTGNYHAGTARAYTDFGLLTCDPEIGEDVNNVFLQLTGLGKVSELNHLLQSPFTLHEAMIEKIDREAALAREGKSAHIMARMNALIEPKIIQALYRASQAGVKIEMVIRGICCLRPGIEGISENIHVRSVMGRFLEHPRVYYFHNDGKEEVYASSADWMPRNLFRRVEVAFPILDENARKRIIWEAFHAYLSDNSQSWILQSNGEYWRLSPDQQAPIVAQEQLLEQIAG